MTALALYEVDSQSPSTSATFDSFAQQPDSILFNASHNSTFSVGETSQATINPSILNVSPLEQDVVHLQLNNHQEGLRQTGQDEAAQILESHYQASPCRLKSCRLQEMCRLTGLTKKQVREWFKQRRKIDNPVDPLVNAHEGPQFACNNIQSTSFTLVDFLEGIFQRGCVPTIPDGWKKLSEETKVDVATLYQWFNQRFQFHQRAQQKAGRTTQKQWQKQIEGVLEKQFQHSPILNPLKKEYLCQKSGWTEAMIISWFMQRNQKKWNEDRNHTFNPFSLNYLENKFRNNNQADKMDMEEMKCLTGADPSQILLWFETRRSHEHMKMPTKQMPRAIDANAFADFMARCNEAAGPSATLQHPNQVQPQGFAQQQGPFNFQPQHCTSNSLNFMQYMQQIPWSSEQDVAGRLSAPKQRRQKDLAPTNKFGPSMVSNELSHLNDPSIFNQSHSLPTAVNRILPQFSSTVLECFNKKINIV
uniref:Homeobox domain-containing protein n=1 Tax=Ditylenchus dipsaci TaxID=166011 RepID=A0A915EIL3_9BILA